MQARADIPGTRLGGEAFESRGDGRVALTGGACAECGNRSFPRAPVCCVCMSENVAAEVMPREGTLYAFSRVHVAAKKWKKPMCIGYIDLPNGARVFAHLDGSDLKIGDTVEPVLGTVGEDENGAIETFVFRKIS